MCEKKDLVPEMVYILGRMGDNKKALMLIIERLGDVQRVSASLFLTESCIYRLPNLISIFRRSTLPRSKRMMICGRTC